MSMNGEKRRLLGMKENKEKEKKKSREGIEHFHVDAIGIQSRNCRRLLLLLALRPFRPAKLDNVALAKHPVLAGSFALIGQLRSPNGRSRNHLGILRNAVLQADDSQTAGNSSKNTLQEATLFTLAQNEARPHNDALVKLELFNGRLDALLHLAVGRGRRQQAIGAGAGDEDKGLNAGLLRGAGHLDVEVVVNLPLVLDAAGGCARGANGREGDVRRGREADERGGPLAGVGVDDGVEAGRFGLWCAAGDGGDGLEGAGGQEVGQDEGAHEAGRAKDGGGVGGHWEFEAGFCVGDASSLAMEC